MVGLVRKKGTPKFDPTKKGNKEDEQGAGEDKQRTSEKGKRKNPRENWIRTARKRMEEARADFRRNIKEAESDAKAREATAKSRATTESRLRTWDAVTEDVFAEGQVARPEQPHRLSEKIVQLVMAFFVRNKYRTANLYLSDAVQRHRRKFDLSTSLVTQINVSERAAMRGIGPPDRKDPLDFPESVNLSDTPRLTCISVWFLMRGDEISTANLGDVTKSSLGKNGPEL